MGQTFCEAVCGSRWFQSTLSSKVQFKSPLMKTYQSLSHCCKASFGGRGFWASYRCVYIYENHGYIFSFHCNLQQSACYNISIIVWSQFKHNFSLFVWTFAPFLLRKGHVTYCPTVSFPLLIVFSLSWLVFLNRQVSFVCEPLVPPSLWWSILHWPDFLELLPLLRPVHLLSAKGWESDFSVSLLNVDS